VACLFALAALDAGRSVRAIDTDGLQATSHKWLPDLFVSAPGLSADELRSMSIGYDLTVIDCPPSVLPVAISAIEAADWVLTPTGLSAGDLQALMDFRTVTDPHLVIPVRVDYRRTLHHQALEALKDWFGEAITVPIPNSAAVERAQIEHCGLPALSAPAVAMRQVYEQFSTIEKERA